ncbi:indole-3-acetic acid-induced protein ARG7-like [Trifolium pratense]|uniref:indole-3-acetic acid-induced protein ARG7-like n=1 Tax=Trifolium pratense TaxID=57577 RepID=UPI001E69608B|nr:indole-3-acetic acid-induced protein ARG7-like [Trifolium pratense]
MKVGGISISTPKLPMPIDLNSSTDEYNSFHRTKTTTSHKKSLLIEAGESSDGSRKTSKVPKGYIAVYVGLECRRFVIPISFLSMPELKGLMDDVAEEFGCDYHADGALHIPCDEDYFRNVLINCFATQRRVSSKNYKIKLGSKIPLIDSQ